MIVAVACLVVDRDRVRERVRAAGDRLTDTGFRLGPRGWRLAAGFFFGCSCAVKWSGIYFLALFAVLSLFWDRSAWPRPACRTPRGRHCAETELLDRCCASAAAWTTAA